MVSPNDLSSTYETEHKNVIAKTPIFFYRNGKQAFVPLEEHIIDRLKLTRQDLFIQEITADGSILLRRLRD